MRYGVISDVHANLPALEAVLEALERLGVDAYACAGDLVGYGPQPNECVDVVSRLGAACVAGNHDLIALGELSEERCERVARESLQWTRAALDAATRDYLAGLPRRLELPGGVVVSHGSLDDPQEYVLRPDQAAGQLRRLAELHPEAGILVLGHTHRALASTGIGTASGRVSLGAGEPLGPQPRRGRAVARGAGPRSLHGARPRSPRGHVPRRPLRRPARPRSAPRARASRALGPPASLALEGRAAPRHPR